MKTIYHCFKLVTIVINKLRVNLIHIIKVALCLVVMIRDFVKQGGYFSWSHTLREGNLLADYLTNFAHSFR